MGAGHNKQRELQSLTQQWRREGGGGRTAAPGDTLHGAAYEGRKFGILVFALQCVSASLYLFLIYSMHRLTVLFTWRVNIEAVPLPY